MAEKLVGRVLALALRGADNGPMREVNQVQAIEDTGLAGDPKTSIDRGLTLLASQQWEQVAHELDENLPWHTRRANILVETDSLLHLVGKTLRIGEAHMTVRMESKPCGLMDQLHQGLRSALATEGRGGVAGRVIGNGTIRVGNEVALID